MNNRICNLFGIEFPIIQGGMVWCSGWRLASSVSEAGGLGLIGAGSMYPEVLREHIQKAKKATSKPFGVNIPLLYPDIEALMKIILEENVKIVFTSAGNPKTWTSHLKENGIVVCHVVSSSKFALKAQSAGVDAIVAEGFEAGGHNGREETTTMVLLPSVRKNISIPVIAAGGIGSGAAMAASFALGAEGVQIGSLFAASCESSAHDQFKNRVIESSEGETILTLKEITPVRILKNQFYEQVKEAHSNCKTKSELIDLLGKRRAKAGIFEGDLENGELEIGQISSEINQIKPASVIVSEIMEGFTKTIANLNSNNF